MVAELTQKSGQIAQVKGWLNNTRSLGKVNFLILRDRTGFAQVVVDKEQFQPLSHLQPGSILTITGRVVHSTQASLGVEIVEPTIVVEVAVEDPPPIEYYKPTLQSEIDFILDHRPMALRNREIQAVFKIQAELAHAYRLYMHDQVQATEYFAPNMIGASSEGGAEFFTVDYFGYTATLAQSSQLYKQMMVGVNERVFALMPFFRAENSNTSRHLTEGKQFEFEMGFFTHWHEILDLQEGCIKFMVSYLQSHCADQIDLLGGHLIKAPHDVSIPRLTFAEAQQIYFTRTGIDEREELDLSPAAERELCSYAKERFGTDLCFVTDWKTSKRPFYAFPNETNSDLTNTFDLLCAGTEITSGGQRRHTYESMIEGIVSKGMNPEEFSDYLTIFKYGMPPHGGFGMGLERLTMTLLGLKNIREASLFPSDPRRIAGSRIRSKIFFGAETIRNEIIRLLRESECSFSLTKEVTVKSIILRGKSSKKNYQITTASHLKLDMKRVSQLLGEKCEFEKREVIEERFGLSLESIPPFGQLLNIETYFEESVVADLLSFSSGVEGESITMNREDFLKIVAPKLCRSTQ